MCHNVLFVPMHYFVHVSVKKLKVPLFKTTAQTRWISVLQHFLMKTHSQMIKKRKKISWKLHYMYTNVTLQSPTKTLHTRHRKVALPPASQKVASKAPRWKPTVTERALTPTISSIFLTAFTQSNATRMLFCSASINVYYHYITIMLWCNIYVEYSIVVVLPLGKLNQNRYLIFCFDSLHCLWNVI